MGRVLEVHEVGEFERTRYSLQFKDPGVEMAFAVGRQDRLLKNFVKLALLVIFVSSTSFIHRLFFWVDLNDNAKISEFSEMVLVVVGMGIVVFIKARKKFGCIDYTSVEVACCATIIFVLVQIVSCEELFLDIVTETDRGTSIDARLAQLGRVVLVMDAVLTGSHLSLPINWFVMVWVDVLSVILFLIYSLLVAGLSYDVVRSNVIFISLVCAASIGQRAQEANERELFCTIVTERSLRAMEEFRAATRETSVAPRPDDLHSASGRGAPSVTSTTHTGALFERTALNDSVILEDLQKLGVQEHWLIDRGHLSIFPDEVLGTGNFGKVLGGKFCSSKVAVKMCLKHKEGAIDKMVCNELRILRHVRHPNLVLFHGACIDIETKDVMLVLERVHGSNLDMTIAKLQALKSTSPYSATQTDVMRQVCQALIYLHSRSPCLVHGDLSPNNILVERRGLLDRHEARYTAKLLDFGLSRTISRNSKVGGGTPHFMAPEIVRNTTDYRPRSSHDIFSLGRLLFYMASGRRPLKSMTDKEIVSLAREGRLPPVMWHPATALLAVWRATAESCMSEEPRDRPPVQEVHDFLENNQVRRTREDTPPTPTRQPKVPPGGLPAGTMSSDGGSLEAYKEGSELSATSASSMPDALQMRSRKVPMSSPETSSELLGGSSSWNLNWLATIPEQDSQDCMSESPEPGQHVGGTSFPVPGSHESGLLMDPVMQL